MHTFLAGDVIRAKIDSTRPIRLYLASKPGGTNSTAAELTAMAEVSLPVSVFGDIDLSVHRFLTAVSAADCAGVSVGQLLRKSLHPVYKAEAFFTRHPKAGNVI